MKKIVFVLLSFGLAAELEVDGDLKVTGTVDASGNPITNVGEPLLSTDAASAGYVLTAAAGKGRIITLKCPWVNWAYSPDILTCTPPSCPADWVELVTFNEIVSMAMYSNAYKALSGNSVRYCMEQEEE